MRTAGVQRVPRQWPEILRWLAEGEEVQVTRQDKVVAKAVGTDGASHLRDYIDTSCLLPITAGPALQTNNMPEKLRLNPKRRNEGPQPS
jgi:antitoxin (DNA-binding transcriptional repressor) of toxin-antitoxin stability system